jgi:VIT1/CCC1 family predicted Fe2+/Mn2+ transporter
MILLRRLHRHLDPSLTLGELIFGLIMVLTFTLGARLLGPEEPLDSRELLVAALGCNIAWGIIDGFLYLLGEVYERRRLATLQARVKAGDSVAGLAVVREEYSGGLAALGSPAERDRFHAAIAAAATAAPAGAVRVTGADWWGAFLIFLLVAVTAIPAALPFLFIEDSYIALRASNALLTLLLFVVGYLWGQQIGARPWLAGALIMSIGIALVLVAIPLGG